MSRSGIEVTTETRELINAARVDMYADAGMVLNSNLRILFLLGVWQYVRDTPAGVEACQVTADNLRQATSTRGE